MRVVRAGRWNSSSDLSELFIEAGDIGSWKRIYKRVFVSAFTQPSVLVIFQQLLNRSVIEGNSIQNHHYEQQDLPRNLRQRPPQGEAILGRRPKNPRDLPPPHLVRYDTVSCVKIVNPFGCAGSEG